MIPIDNLLLKIVNFNSPCIEEVISSRDCNVLRSLASSINSHLFVTENQGRLAIKILKDNSAKLTEFTEEIEQAITTPLWSRTFRQVEQIKRLYLERDADGDFFITVDFTFNTAIRKALQLIDKACENLIVIGNGKKYSAEYTEKNLVLLVDALLEYDFDIDEQLQAHYATIKSWPKTDTCNQFLLTNIEYPNFHKAITADLGIETELDQNIINDRSVRYQYLPSEIKNPGETLTEYIANRSKTKIWVDKNQHSLSDIISSLIDLKRLPLLIIFDTVVNNKYKENLQILSDALLANGIVNDVGIYFRLPNDDSGKDFNKLIATNKYNYPLGITTQVAGVSSGKLPKFFLKNAWKPMSVITLDSHMGMRHGKTAIYANCCDLIIEWSSEPAIIDQRLIIK